MDREYVVMTTGQPRQWQGNDGVMHAWPTMFVGEDMPADVHRPANVPGPQPNDKMFGSIGQMNKHGTRSFKRGQQPAAQTALNGSSGQEKDEVDWEGRNRLILEEASNNAAALVVAAAVQSGQLEFDKAIERHKEYSAILSSHAVVRSRYGTGEPEPTVEFNGAGATPAPAEYVPQPGEAVTEPAGASFTTAFDSASD